MKIKTATDLLEHKYRGAKKHIKKQRKEDIRSGASLIAHMDDVIEAEKKKNKAIKKYNKALMKYNKEVEKYKREKNKTPNDPFAFPEPVSDIPEGINLFTKGGN